MEALAADFAGRLASGVHRDALNEAVEALEQRFCGNDHVEGFRRDGAVAAAMFLHGSDAGEEERILEQRNASALVSEFLRLVRGQ